MTRPVLLLLLLAACDGWIAPQDAYQIMPPPEYAVWWQASRACVNRPEYRTFAEVEWYLSPAALIDKDGSEHGAMSIDNRVYLWSSYYATAPWVIQHELVHAINMLGNDHPADPFERCGLTSDTAVEEDQ